MKTPTAGCVLAAWLFASGLQAAPTTEVISLNHTLAESLLPAIEPILSEDERISAYGNQLILRAEPNRITTIREAISTLDQQPSRLRISVANTEAIDQTQRGYQVNGRIAGGGVEVTTGDSRNGNQTRIIRRETRGATDGVRQITANEGYPVMIQRGSSVPVTTTTSNAYGQVLQQTEYRDVAEGFYATVRINGNLATIYLNANNDRVNRSDNRIIDIQRADTVVTAPLGEWVTVAGIDDSESINDTGIGKRISTRGTNQSSLRLKVERLD
ncbi:hypothetical protein SAMN05216421_1219 [Halopseudomonas xinjiangensis]|uniref:NolW-like domain-containing protein n=1 Tax=Halopseudomonas xinjiangensis TaxID=487184 RepID=A0A1H1QUR7_9GAMM|nr:secretin N-terminal domain-containing protein [Halopseudomonas xinjiangensis]SDS27262.1 hypothetical protein SAMN05216421_1219 [Halopseudomonas xinjiangensis]